MNKHLINKISQKSAAHAKDKTNNVYSDEYFDYYNAKFAELVVNECANICNNFKFTNEGPSYEASYQRSLCSITIKEHFGLTSKGPISSRPIR